MFPESFSLIYFLMYYEYCSLLTQSKHCLGVLEAGMYSGKGPHGAVMEGVEKLKVPVGRIPTWPW